MDALTKFEEEFSLPRASWKVTQWRKVALSLADIEEKEARGRKKRTEAEAYEEEQNLLALEFQIKQELEYLLHVLDSKSGLSIPRKNYQKNITREKAIENILKRAAEREMQSSNIKPPKLDGLIKRLQLLKKNSRIKKMNF